MMMSPFYYGPPPSGFRLGSRNDVSGGRNDEAGAASGWGGSAPDNAEGDSIDNLAFVAE